MKTLKQFIDITKVSRSTSEKEINKLIKQYKIKNDDLIADIYQYLGI